MVVMVAILRYPKKLLMMLSIVLSIVKKQHCMLKNCHKMNEKV